MNSRLDWLVLSDYYSIYVTNAPPEARNTNRFSSYFLLFFVLSKGFERVGSWLVTKRLYFTEKRAGQTTDGTVVCNPGVIASVRKRK